MTPSQLRAIILDAYNACAATAENFGRGDIAATIRKAAFYVEIKEKEGGALEIHYPRGVPKGEGEKHGGKP